MLADSEIPVKFKSTGWFYYTANAYAEFPITQSTVCAVQMAVKFVIIRVFSFHRTLTFSGDQLACLSVKKRVEREFNLHID